MDTSQLASSQEIDVMIVIDTDYVKEYMKSNNLTPCTDDITKAVPIDHAGKYMIVPTTNVAGGQATGDLNFTAKAGDTVCFRGCSIYQNSDDAIIICKVENYDGVDVFNGNLIHYEGVNRKQAAIPDYTKADGLPALSANVLFQSLDGRIGITGKGYYYIYFALYTLDPQNSDKQNLFSYCRWDPIITVK